MMGLKLNHVSKRVQEDFVGNMSDTKRKIITALFFAAAIMTMVEAANIVRFPQCP